MRQIYPSAAAGSELADADLAVRYAYPPPRGSDRAFLRANMVASADGAATVRGRSGGLSGAADRHVFALLRALADVILVGAGTARAEGYRPVRPGVEDAAWSWLREGRPPSAPIAVVTRRLDLDLTGALLADSPGHARTIVITTLAAPAAKRAEAARASEVIVAGERDVDLRAAVTSLAGLGHRRILTEGGPHLLAQIVGAGLLDELCLTVSPLLTGPASGRIVQGLPAAAPAGPERPEPLALAHVIEDEGYLLCRYLARGAAPGPVSVTADGS